MTRSIGLDDGWLSRIVKLFPWEANAAYTVINFVLPAGLDYWLLVVFAILLCGNIFYSKRFASINDTLQLWIMSIAFGLWCAAVSQSRLGDFFIGINGPLSWFFEKQLMYVLVALFLAIVQLFFPHAAKALSTPRGGT